MLCPKCGYQRTAIDDLNISKDQCPACDIYYFKYINQKSVPIRTAPQNHETSLTTAKKVAVRFLMEIKLLATFALQQIHTAWSSIPKIAHEPIKPASVKPQPSETQILLAMTESARFKTNHTLHFLISFFTIGLWLIIWFAIAASNTSERNKIYRKYGLTTESNKSAVVVSVVFIFLLTSIVMSLINH